MISAEDISRRTQALGEKLLFASTRRLGALVERRILVPVWERRMGISTSGVIEADELGYEEEETLPYQPSEWRSLRRSLARDSVSSADAFLDLGSGLGRVVLMAGEFPFRRIIGVELSAGLHDAATANLERARIDRPERIELVRADVREYEIPDDVTVVFMFNPFRFEIFDAAMAQVFASYDRAPRRMRIVYRLPREHERLLATGRVRILAETKNSPLQGLPRRVGAVTYELLPASS
jgi:SAM-dependent methyltransferase